MNQIPKTLSKCFRADDTSLWEDFIQRFAATHGNICYYPSTGSDFRPLIYQQNSVMERLGLVDDGGLFAELDFINPVHSSPKPATEYEEPDLWLFSDFCPESIRSNGLESGTHHFGRLGKVRVIEKTEIHPAAGMLQVRLNEEYTSLSPSPMTGHAFYLRLLVTNEASEAREAREVDAIYFCYENINLLHEFIIRHRVPISHLVWVQDGADFGGGTLRHDFLIPLMPLLRTRWLFTSESYFENTKVENWISQIQWPRELLANRRSPRTPVTNFKEIGRFDSGGNRIVFCDVKASRVETSPRPPHEIREAFVRSKKPDPVYLWLNCEGWMSFGPFESLVFEDRADLILDSSEKIVAWREAGGWRTHLGRGVGMLFRSPTISSSQEYISPKNIRAPEFRWQDFFEGEFQVRLKDILARFPCDSDCEHCRAPMELRVLLPKHRGLRNLLPDELIEPFFCCWYGMVLVSQGVHQLFPESSTKWSQATFCPLPVENIGMGCVRVRDAQDLLSIISIPQQRWGDFILFFSSVILRDLEKVTEISPESFMAVLRSARIRENNSSHPLEAQLLGVLNV